MAEQILCEWLKSRMKILDLAKLHKITHSVCMANANYILRMSWFPPAIHSTWNVVTNVGFSPAIYLKPIYSFLAGGIEKMRKMHTSRYSWDKFGDNWDPNDFFQKFVTLNDTQVHHFDYFDSQVYQISTRIHQIVLEVAV